MSLLDTLFGRKKSASKAKDRLQIIISQERTKQSAPDYLPMLRKEIIDVIAKYTHVDLADIIVDLHQKDNESFLELNVALPSNAEIKKPETAASEKPKTKAKAKSASKAKPAAKADA